jgi:hypothetical protein
MTELNNTVIKITYNSDNGIISSFWKKRPESDQIKEAMEYKVSIARKYQTGRLYFDPTNLGSINDDDKNWIKNIFIPKIISAAGYAKIANVVPLDIFTKISRQEILTTAARMSNWYFDNEENAIKWLREENNQVKDLIKMYPCEIL